MDYKDTCLTVGSLRGGEGYLHMRNHLSSQHVMCESQHLFSEQQKRFGISRVVKDHGQGQTYSNKGSLGNCAVPSKESCLDTPEEVRGKTF